MSTTYGAYKYARFNPEFPLHKSDIEEYNCSLCEKKWIGTMTCFECHPSMIQFLLPRPEFLRFNNFNGEIPANIEDCLPDPVVRKNATQIIAGMRLMPYQFLRDAQATDAVMKQVSRIRLRSESLGA
jgi:hypothetical protein